MAHRTHWLVPTRIVMVTLKGEIMAGEVQQIADDLYNTISSTNTSHIVHMIVDARECAIQDKIWNYARVHLQRHPSNGWTIVLGDSRLIGLVMAIFSKVLNTRIYYSATLESAMIMLAERDSSIAKHLQEHREPATTAKTR